MELQLLAGLAGIVFVIWALKKTLDVFTRPGCFGHKYQGEACWNCHYLSSCTWRGKK